MQPSNHEQFLNKNPCPLVPRTAADGEDGTSKQDQDSIFSLQKSIMDYVTLEGIENRTGIEKENVFTFILKELLDNAVDFLETQRNSVSQKRRIAYEIIPAVAQIEVTISKQIDFLSIVVSNSNEYGKSVFSKDRLHSIFDFDTFYSSKRSQYKITRRALGDAFKEILCTPYALVGIQQEQQSHTGWNEPLIMRTKINKTLQTFFVILITDKVNQTIHTKIVEQKEDEEEKSKLSPQSPQQQPNFTEIEVRLPIVKNILDIAKLRRFLLDYTTFNTRIDLAPFVDLVAETTVKACSGGLNSRISLARINGGIEGDDTSVIGRLRRLLRQRFDSVKQDPSLIDRQKWTQSTVFYRLRQILLSYGYSNEEIDRQYITSQIKAVCEENLGVKCEEIGITAADRAQLYFKGKYHDVGLEISDLVEYGTDMLIVEKEGVVKQLAPFADEKGIALLNTRGFLTEYASILSEQSHKNGCNIGILTDFDASGLLIANGIPDIFRIGIDFDTLNYFGLGSSTVEESYKPKPNHLKPLQKLAEDSLSDLMGEEDDDLYEKVEYVSEKRIEIDSIMAVLNDNTAFWGFVLSKLEEKFATRNYNRAIDIPEYVTPDCLRALNDKVRVKSTAILEKERIKMKEKFSNVKGFLDVKQYDRSVPKQLKTIIEHDKTVKPILQMIEDLVKGDFLT